TRERQSPGHLGKYQRDKKLSRPHQHPCPNTERPRFAKQITIIGKDPHQDGHKGKRNRKGLKESKAAPQLWLVAAFNDGEIVVEAIGNQAHSNILLKSDS